jgi:hypothetical protein
MADTDIWSCPDCHQYYYPSQRMWEFKNHNIRYGNISCPDCMQEKLRRYFNLYQNMCQAAGQSVGAGVPAGTMDPSRDYELVNIVSILYTKAHLYDQMEADRRRKK